MALKQRSEVQTDFTWNFTDMYPSDEAWEAAYSEAEGLIGGVAAIQGTLGKSSEAMKAGLDLLFDAMQKIELLYVYSMLRLNVDNGDPKYQTMNGRAMNLLVKVSTATSFLEPEILSIPADKLAEMINDPLLCRYKHMLQDTDRGRAHVGSAEIEHMMAMLSDVSGTAKSCFTSFESVDMTFPEITDENGEKVTLTHGNFGVYRESTDQRVRRESFEAYFGEFKKYINTLASMYAGSVKMDNFYTRARKFDSSCEKALFGNNVPVDVYDKLTEAVHGGLSTMRRYLDLRRRVLGLDELNMYDLYCPMVADVDMKVTFDEAKELVKKATMPLGEEYQKLLDRAFSERWIDVYENKGKTTGAYSCGVFGVHPYVLLNYTDTLDDAFTLAHELGHAMHSYFSDTTQDFANHDYRILVAEVASTVNEVLLTRYLLSTETDPARRAYILNHFLEGFRTTVFRQTLFAEFERQAHDLDMNGTPLTAEVLNGIYRKLNELYYEGATVNELQDIEWARIPHFYNAFYVYQYATGFCSAVSIAKKILEENGAADYLRFLSTGGSDYPLEELKITGVDLTKPDTVASAMEEFDRALTELEGLLA
ncbi:MAG: oligoendopeptidase F [Clostridia bacterium]|nr:oligoendopeptidase F [Clostridia bacterium]